MPCDVSFVIVNFNTREFVLDCLRSVYQQTNGVSFEIIVVDNASADGSSAAIRAEFPKVSVIDAGENLGFGRANNLGAERAAGDYLFFLNSDTVLLNDAASILLSFLSSRPSCGICGGNLEDARGRPTHSYRLALPSPLSDFERFIPDRMRDRLNRNWQYNHSGKPRRVGYVTGADMFMPKSIFRSVGGFDPRFFMYYEETELTHRVVSRGYEAYSVPEARILHHKGASLESLESSRSIVFESKLLYLRIVYGDVGAAVGHLAFAAYYRTRSLAMRIVGHPSLDRCRLIMTTERAAYRDYRVARYKGASR